MKLRYASLFSILVLTLAFAAPAVGQTNSPNADAYRGVAGQQIAGSGGEAPGGGVAGTAASGTAPAANAGGNSASSGGKLPFTGAELGIFALVGLGLLGAGFVLRRVSRAGDLA